MPVPMDWPQQIVAAGGAYWPQVAFNDEPFEAFFVMKNVDYSGATFEGGVRAAFEETSPVLKTFTFTKTLLGADTVVKFTIAEVDIEALRFGSDSGAIETLFYNIKCTPSGGSKATYFAGEFKLQGA